MSRPTNPSAQATIFNGNILLFYAFDVGDDIDLNSIKRQHLVDVCTLQASSFFKNYHIPLAFNLPSEPAGPKDAQQPGGPTIFSSKLYNFGVLSLVYRIPFKQTFQDLKLTLIDLKKHYDHIAELDGKRAFKEIFPAIKKPRFDNMSNAYFAVQVSPLKDRLTAEEFKERYGSRIASLLKLETMTLSDYHEDEILSSCIGYYGQDLIIIDSEASFIYDDEYQELIEFFESANIQRLELQYFDRLLDRKLNFFYAQESYRVPWSAYIPLIGQRIELPISRLAKLRVDISVVTERLENSIKMAGDAYYANLYTMLMRKMSIQGWRDSINRKLDIIHDLYSVYQDRLDAIHDECMSVVIIALIAIEVVALFVR